MNSPSGAAEREAFQAWAATQSFTGTEVFAALDAWQAASAGRDELVEALEEATEIIDECGRELGAGPFSVMGQSLMKYRALLAKHKGV